MIRRTACLVSRSMDAWRNQAMEKHLMDTLPEDTALLFLWQAKQAVLLGRGQSARESCRLEELKGGQLARRLSGGGGMYVDEGTLFFSLIVPRSAFDISRQMSMLGMALGAFGLQASAVGCDLGVNGACVGRTAFFKSGSAAWQHGVLLAQTDCGQMARLLSGDGQQRFSTAQSLNQLCPAITVDSLERSLCQAFAHAYGSEPAWLDERMLDGRTMEELAIRFAAECWLCPPEDTPTCALSQRFPWGGASVSFVTEGGIIRRAYLHSDAMESALLERIAPALIGAPFLISAVTARFDQALEWLSDPRLLQIAQDVCNLISCCIRGDGQEG